MEHKKVIFPARNEMHVLRKTWHVLGGLAMALGYEVLGLTRSEATLAAGSLFGFFLSMEVARRFFPQLNKFLIKFWSPFIRSHEVSQNSGMFYFSAGAFLIALLFAKPIVMLSLIYLSIGDPLASLLGILFKGLTILRVRSGKSLVGTFGMFGICFTASYFLLSNAGLTFSNALGIAVIGSLTASLAELSCPDTVPLDDNFFIPVMSAIALWLGFQATGINPHYLHLFTSPLKFR
jgi:diacylglycerol kinase (CTP)